jgi:hypothetical protein
MKSFFTKISERIFIFSIFVYVLLLFGCGLSGTRPSPLNQAAWDNDVNAIKTLVEQGDDVEQVTDSPIIGSKSSGFFLQSTPLCMAIYRGNIESVKALVEYGSDVNKISTIFVSKNSSLWALGTPLMLASLRGKDDIVEFLLKKGAKIDMLAPKQTLGFRCKYVEGYDVLFFASRSGYDKVAKILLENGANPNLKSKKGSKAVYEALANGYIDIAILLIENGLKIESDQTYIHYNAELAHMAADYYASYDEKKSIQFYTQAIKFYPAAVKNYESIASGKWLKEIGKTMFAAAATSFNSYAGKQGVNTAGSFVGSNYYTYQQHNYNPNFTEEEYFRQKAKDSEKGQNACKKILSCYEKKEPEKTMLDCMKETYSMLIK